MSSRQPLGPQGVDAPLGVRMHVHEPGRAQDAQVLGGSGLRDAERVHELAHGPRGVEQEVEDPQPRGLGEHGEQAMGGSHRSRVCLIRHVLVKAYTAVETGPVRFVPILLAAVVVGLVLPGAALGCGYEVHCARRARSRPAIARRWWSATRRASSPRRLARRGLEANAQECRQFDAGVDMLRGRRAAGTLGHLAVLALGANGPVSAGQLDAALRAAARGRVLGLVTPRNLASSANAMRAAAARRPGRILLIDWQRFSAGHDAWFAADGLHVNRPAPPPSHG